MISRDESITVGSGALDDSSVGDCTARVLVTDDGLYGVAIENPQIIESASNAVGLLPLDTIKEILQEEVMERTANYNIYGYGFYNYLHLLYLKVSDEEEERVSSIPVWCLSYRSGREPNIKYEHPVFVNAIDGTIVHYADAESTDKEIPDVEIPDAF